MVRSAPVALPLGFALGLAALGIAACRGSIEGPSHSMKNGNHPIVIVGKANGALKPGSFIRPPSVENGSKVCVAMLRALGINAPFGVAAGMANEPLPGILA